MQVCNCTVAIAGEAGMTVAKSGVTIAELLVLRAMHGDDAVRNVEITGTVDVSAPEERERLALIYRKPPTLVRDTLGAQGSLPKTIDDTNFPEDFILSAPPKKGGRPKKATGVQELVVEEFDATE
jgi:hypothetical protein